MPYKGLLGFGMMIDVKFFEICQLVAEVDTYVCYVNNVRTAFIIF